MERIVTQQELSNWVSGEPGWEVGKCSSSREAWARLKASRSGTDLREAGHPALRRCREEQGRGHFSSNWRDLEELRASPRYTDPALVPVCNAQEIRGLGTGNRGRYGWGPQRGVGRLSRCARGSRLRLDPPATDSDQIQALGKGPAKCLHQAPAESRGHRQPLTWGHFSCN